MATREDFLTGRSLYPEITFAVRLSFNAPDTFAVSGHSRATLPIGAHVRYTGAALRSPGALLDRSRDDIGTVISHETSFPGQVVVDWHSGRQYDTAPWDLDAVNEWDAETP